METRRCEGGGAAQRGAGGMWRGGALGCRPQRSPSGDAAAGGGCDGGGDSTLVPVGKRGAHRAPEAEAGQRAVVVVVGIVVVGVVAVAARPALLTLCLRRARDEIDLLLAGASLEGDVEQLGLGDAEADELREEGAA